VYVLGMTTPDWSSDDPFGEARRVAAQIHAEWPFIPEAEAKAFYLSLGHTPPGEGAVRVSLWVLARVLREKAVQ
jgi:hypothetical protein